MMMRLGYKKCQKNYIHSLSIKIESLKGLKDKKTYNDTVKDAKKFRAYRYEFIKQFPQLFPAEIAQG